MNLMNCFQGSAFKSQVLKRLNIDDKSDSVHTVSYKWLKNIYQYIQRVLPVRMIRKMQAL